VENMGQALRQEALAEGIRPQVFDQALQYSRAG